MMIQILRQFYRFSAISFPKNSVFALLLGLMLNGCAGFGNAPPPGTPENQVVQTLGHPNRVIQDGQTRILEYNQGFGSQYTYLAKIGPDNRLLSYEQVLTDAKFASIPIGRATKDMVLRTVGSPLETSRLPLKDLEVWSYPYKESGVWDSVMHVQFDRNGIVQSLQNTPDLRFDPDTRFRFLSPL